MGTFNAKQFGPSQQARIGRALSKMVPIDCYELTNPAAADVAGLLAATASSVAVQVKLVAALLAPGIAALLAYPRSVSFTTAGGTPADAPATATIVGTDIDGAPQTEVVNISQSAATVHGVKAYKALVSITYAAGEGAGATVAIGFGNKFGLPTKPKVRAGGVASVAEFTSAVLSATRATYVIPATSAPYGTVEFNSVPDAAKDYAVWFERDIAAGV